MGYKEWVEARDQARLEAFGLELQSRYLDIANTLSQMAGMEMDLWGDPDKAVEDALSVLRQQDPLGGRWATLAGDYQRLRKSEAQLA